MPVCFFEKTAINSKTEKVFLVFSPKVATVVIRVKAIPTKAKNKHISIDWNYGIHEWQNSIFFWNLKSLLSLPRSNSKMTMIWFFLKLLLKWLIIFQINLKTKLRCHGHELHKNLGCWLELVFWRASGSETEQISEIWFWTFIEILQVSNQLSLRIGVKKQIALYHSEQFVFRVP